MPWWFLRHGQTDWNARNISQGNVDIPLNATGLAQARAAAEALVGRGIRAIVASPLSRARVTAEIVAERLGLAIAEDAGLREAAFGVQEGQPMATWFPDWVEERFTPDGGESFRQLTARAVAAVNRALARPGPVLVVSHGALFRALRGAMELEPNVRTPNGAPLHLRPGPGGWRLAPAAGFDEAMPA